MAYLLDTTTLSLVLKGNERVTRRFQIASSSGAVFASVISEGELVYGALRLGKERRRELLEDISLIVGDMSGVLPVTRTVAFKYGEIFSRLAAKGEVIGLNDLWIGATALSGGLTLATSDKAFGRVQGLSVEDWLEP